MKPRLALVGDYSPHVLAHQAIPRALELASAADAGQLTWQWVATRDIRHAARNLAKFSAVWLVPASPYDHMAGALDAVRFARETQRPFLGTCGGFQHALIEVARHVAGLPAADHAETNPDGTTLVIAPLSCSLVEKSETLRLVPGSLLHAAYGAERATEGYHCSYGVSPDYRRPLERAGLRFTAFDDTENIRAAELPTDEHPFFVGTLFQPERAALRDQVPPLVRAFLRAISAPDRTPVRSPRRIRRSD